MLLSSATRRDFILQISLFSQDNRINYRVTWCVGRGGRWEGRTSNNETDKFLGALSQINERMLR